MQIESGKYYRRRDGKKAGPMKFRKEYRQWLDPEFGYIYFLDGLFFSSGKTDRVDLIAEWTDTPDPAADPTNPAKLPLGDMTPEAIAAIVRCCEREELNGGEWKPQRTHGLYGTRFYRIPPAPVVGSVTLYGRGDAESDWFTGKCSVDTHTLTLPTRDGKAIPDKYTSEAGHVVVIAGNRG